MNSEIFIFISLYPKPTGRADAKIEDEEVNYWYIVEVQGGTLIHAKKTNKGKP